MPLSAPSGRQIGYLRLSLTKACQMKCTYCRPTWLRNGSASGDLSVDEIGNLVSFLVEEHGLRKVRLTGGDPTARPDLLEIIERVASVPGLQDLAMTTNGLTLASRARDYASAGLRRVNVSLDSLDRRTFHRMTGVDGLGRVLNGLEAALDAGLFPLRLNTVVMRDHNEDHLVDLIEYAARIGADIRFIELMPMGPLASQWAERYVPEAEMRQRLETSLTGWDPILQEADSARRFRVTTPAGRRAVVGFITPMSCNFCGACNRIRVAADGEFFPCLMDQPAGSLLPGLRPTFDPALLNRLLDLGLRGKSPEHPVQGFVTMTHIGG